MTAVAGTREVVADAGGAKVPPSGLNLKAEDFLQLLAAQLRYQNPLEPLDNTQFMGQLAQFAMLQEVAGLRGELGQVKEDLEKLRQAIDEQEAGRAVSLIGMQVKVQGENGIVQEGVVSGVRLVNGRPLLLLGDVTAPLDAVLEMAPVAPPGGSDEEPS